MLEIWARNSITFVMVSLQTSILPKNVEYELIKEVESTGEVKFRANVRSAETLNQWIKNFQCNMHWAVQRTRPKTYHLLEVSSYNFQDFE